jgi:hypothetical protein
LKIYQAMINLITIKSLFIASCLILLPNLIFSQSDDPCGAPALTVGASCTFSVGTNATATASAGVPAPGCANYAGGDVWYTITVPASGDITVDMNTGVITDAGMAIYSGPCGALSLIECDDDDSPNGLMSMIALTGQTPGVTLWVRVWEYGNNNNGTFSICATDPTGGGGGGPANDDPCSASPLAVNASCTFEVGTNASATASAGVPAPGCASYSGGDVWYTLTVPASGSVTVDMNTGVITDAGMAIYSGPCGALSLIECDDDDSPNGLMSMIALVGQTPGATLWIRVWEYGNNNNGTFSICASDPGGGGGGGAPANDDPCAATPLAVGATCSFTTSTNAGATASAGVPAPGCASYSGGDVWFTAVIPPSGTLILDSDVGVITDGGMAVYSGTCASLTLLDCDDDGSANGAMSEITISTEPAGSTVFIRFWEYGNNNNGTFDICAYEGTATGPCGNPANQDYCSNPAILTQGAGTFASNTSATYSADQPGGMTFCGSIENNSWYEFTATATTEVFNFTSVTGCTSGIQAEVFEVTHNASGCCTGLTSVSNCWNPATAAAGTVTATPLVIGNNYVLMVDGYGGNVCDFTVSGWTATGILPVELSEFYGMAAARENVLSWTTASEEDNEGFDILRSWDGVNFEMIDHLFGAGNSTANIDYQFKDEDVRTGIVYYQLNQLDFNGDGTKSNIIALNREQEGTGLLAAWPNPVTNQLFVELNSRSHESKVQILDSKGKILRTINVETLNYSLLTIDIADLVKGVYLLHYTNEDGTNSTTKIIKQ